MTTFDLPPYNPGHDSDPALSPALASSLAGWVERGERIDVGRQEYLAPILYRVGEDAYPVRVSRRGSRYVIEREQTDG